MIRINDNYSKLKSSYLFSEIASRVAKFQERHPDRDIIKMGIGDVTRGLPDACIRAFHEAVDEMAADETFHGYGPERGYPFLTERIAADDYKARGADISADEVFVSDGAKCDTANFQEIFSPEVTIALPDPVYPVYVDTSAMSGRTGEWKEGRYRGLIYLESTWENGYVPDPPAEQADLIYLCFPNNPTGATATKDSLEAWVEYARTNRSLILYDAAYSAFIRDEALPVSIYEVEGAREVAVEFRSFSKTAGFTGTRCAYTVVPKSCLAADAEGKMVSIYDLWSRRQATKFNGVSYPVQKAAAAVYTHEGRRQTRELADYYLRNARLVREYFEGLGYRCSGGDNSPYIWIQTQSDSWEFFDLLLDKVGVVVTPGSGFGKCGEGYIRISSFGSLEDTTKGLDRIAKVVGR